MAIPDTRPDIIAQLNAKRQEKTLVADRSDYNPRAPGKLGDKATDCCNGYSGSHTGSVSSVH